MKPVRYLVGSIGFLLVWFVVAVVVGTAVALMFPTPEDGLVFVGVSVDLRNLPGTILGLYAGIHSFRASIKDPKEKTNKP